LSGTANTAPPERGQVLATEDAALRHVAMLVARGAPRQEIFAAAAEQVARTFSRPWVGVMQYDSAASAVVVATWGDHPFPVGTRWPLDGPSTLETVLRTGRPAAVPDYTGLAGTVAEASRQAGIVGGIGAPIVVDGSTWGVVAVPATRGAPIPAGVETRLSVFTELVAAAISNAEARSALALLADEQAALRRVATLVAREASPAEIFGAVTEEARNVLAIEAVGLLRFDADETATLVAQSDTPWDPPPLGTQLTLDGENVVAQVLRTGEVARMDDWSGSSGAVAALADVLGVRSAVASPVVVEGALWGAIVAATSQSEPLPPDTELRIREFTELVATAVANAEARSQLSRLAVEQAALLRVAELVAKESSLPDVLTGVAEELAKVLGHVEWGLSRDDGDGMATVLAVSDGNPTPAGTRVPIDLGSAYGRAIIEARPARIDDYFAEAGSIARIARKHGVRAAVSYPIVVRGRTWGAMSVGWRNPDALPAQTEAVVARFSDLIATAIANVEARAQVERLADEQAALRRVATLVAEGVPSAELFSGVTTEVAHVFSDVDPALIASVIRFDPGPESVLVGASREYAREPLGARWAPKDLYVSTRVLRTERSARVDEADLDTTGGPDADVLRLRRFLYQVGSPIIVEGSLWGAMCLNSQHELPADTEERLEKFTDLVATAIANAESRGARAVLTEEQAALRRVATLVAHDAPPATVFEAVAAEVGDLLDANLTVLSRYDHDGMATAIGSWSSVREAIPVGTRSSIGGRNVLTIVAETGRPARLDDYEQGTGQAAEIARRYGWRSSIAAPITVEDRVWGAMLVATQRKEPFPAGDEDRLALFTDLVATAVSNAEAHVAVQAAADEQGALRRVATLVAASAAPSAVFAAVTEEIAAVLGADACMLCRADPDGAAVVVGTWADGTPEPAPGTRIARGGTNLVTIVLETGHPARIENYDDASGGASEFARAYGLRSAVGTPILVEGRLWGLVVAGTTRDDPLPSNAEERLAGFTELVATAISNATARAELVASRARIVAAGDEARRRIERNLHDGTQQRLLALGLDLQRARTGIPDDQSETQSALMEAEQDLEAILEDLRELSHGLHPQLLSRLGLGPSLQALARRSPIPVQLDVDLPDRPPASLETAVYYVVSEALTNAIKHSQATEISIAITGGETLEASVVDDGVGGADPGGGSGLVGLLDRVEALGGHFAFDSPPRGGTSISIELPVEPRVVT
jgi:GAF domain-containing protein